MMAFMMLTQGIDGVDGDVVDGQSGMEESPGAECGRKHVCMHVVLTLSTRGTRFPWQIQVRVLVLCLVLALSFT